MLLYYVNMCKDEGGVLRLSGVIQTQTWLTSSIELFSVTRNFGEYIYTVLRQENGVYQMSITMPSGSCIKMLAVTVSFVTSLIAQFYYLHQ